jgi:hypothetical protein
MVNKLHLLNQLVRIEMANLKNICPFVYKITEEKYILPLVGYCLAIDSKHISNDDITGQISTLDNYYLNNDNKIIQNDEEDSPICLSRVYFVNGYNKYVPILSHIDSKYKYTTKYNEIVGNDK